VRRLMEGTDVCSLSPRSHRLRRGTPGPTIAPTPPQQAGAPSCYGGRAVLQPVAPSPAVLSFYRLGSLPACTLGAPPRPCDHEASGRLGGSPTPRWAKLTLRRSFFFACPLIPGSARYGQKEKRWLGRVI